MPARYTIMRIPGKNQKVQTFKFKTLRCNTNYLRHTVQIKNQTLPSDFQMNTIEGTASHLYRCYSLFISKLFQSSN